MKIIQAIIFCFLISGTIQAQYLFKHIKNIECTDIKNQARTGTCWSFATASFLESELIRQGHTDLNLSEMFVVRNIYKNKARNYVLRQGKANFSQGSLSHDLIAAVKRHGIVPDQVYSGLKQGEKAHDHNEMEAGLKGFLDGILQSKRLSKKWPLAFNGILDAYLGKVPTEFMYMGESHTPESFAAFLNIEPDNYISFTSFTHHPFYESFILEIPDNYSNGSFYNLPMDELTALIDHAIENGFSVAWDGDVSEQGFSAREGIAIMPADPTREDLFTMPGEEIEPSQELRQDQFETYATTDDHLMHIVGKAVDQKGNNYYIIKNSWGKISPYEGYMYMSEAYLQMKTVAVMVHRDALTEQINAQMGE